MDTEAHKTSNNAVGGCLVAEVVEAVEAVDNVDHLDLYLMTTCEKERRGEERVRE